MTADIFALLQSVQIYGIFCPEEGLFLALDLGGTNFRVILLELANGVVMRQHVKHYHIGEELRLGCGERLFDFLAECVSEFVRSHNLNGTTLPMGKDCIVPRELFDVIICKLFYFRFNVFF